MSALPQPRVSAREHARELLRRGVNNRIADFRPGQWEAVEALLQRRRLLLVQRTGWGKSNVYFLATRLLRDGGAGCTLLLSPLLALMRNQLDAASRMGVRAETVNSANSDDWERVKEALHRNQVDILLVSPERLANEEFVAEYLLPIAARVGLLVVDEAHCISDWGHDFRPDYRRIVRILRALPANIPVLAATATANDRVVQDITQQLGAELRVSRGALTRSTLRLQNLHLPERAARMAWIAAHLAKFPGSGIIYTLTVQDAEDLANWLRSQAFEVSAYHAGLEAVEREELEQKLLRNELKALVATVALGMGFDKPDLGFVIHYQRPPSVVHYYQQVGRAGRAVDKAYGILLGGAEDDEIADYFLRTAFPTEGEVEDVLEALADAGGPLTLPALQQRVNLPYGKLERALKFMLLESPCPIQKTEKGYVPTPVRWTIPAERIERVQGLRREEQARMREYLQTRECLMQFLARELNDSGADACGRCANCQGRGFTTDISPQLREAAERFLGEVKFEIEPRRQWPGKIGFEGERGRIAEELCNLPGRALTRWGDSSLGKLIRQGKQQSVSFPARLVEASMTLLRGPWQPQPAPQWVTCVPSLRHPLLVLDFAQRLARSLGLPFVSCVRKIKETEPQKTMQNTFQQVRNLESVFRVEPGLVLPGPVLLVDDMVDSRWTLTVVGWKLRQAGSGPVLPFALADSSHAKGDSAA